jgi:hypothetical protein
MAEYILKIESRYCFFHLRNSNVGHVGTLVIESDKYWDVGMSSSMMLVPSSAKMNVYNADVCSWIMGQVDVHTDTDH